MRAQLPTRVFYLRVAFDEVVAAGTGEGGLRVAASGSELFAGGVVVAAALEVDAIGGRVEA